MHPRLVIIHRSSFFHSYNADFKFGLSPQFAKPSDDPRWKSLYAIADDKLIGLLGYIGVRERQTKFLIYSRGTDPSWVEPGFQEQWKQNVEARFTSLKDRITTMTISPGKDRSSPSFRNPENGQELRNRVKTILESPEKRN